MLRTSAGSLKNINIAPDVPVLCLRGKHDLFRGPDLLLRRRFPYAQEVRFENSGHFPGLEEPEQFRVALTAFYHKAAPTF